MTPNQSVKPVDLLVECLIEPFCVFPPRERTLTTLTIVSEEVTQVPDRDEEEEEQEVETVVASHQSLT